MEVNGIVRMFNWWPKPDVTLPAFLSTRFSVVTVPDPSQMQKSVNLSLPSDAFL